jgi:hypothetical protein
MSEVELERVAKEISFKYQGNDTGIFAVGIGDNEVVVYTNKILQQHIFNDMRLIGGIIPVGIKLTSRPIPC